MCRAEPQGIGGYHRGEETPVGAGEPPKPLVPLHALFRLGSSHQRDMINIDRPLWPLRDRVFRGVNVHTGNIPGQEGQGERGSGSSLGSKLHSRHLALHLHPTRPADPRSHLVTDMGQPHFGSHALVQTPNQLSGGVGGVVGPGPSTCCHLLTKPKYPLLTQTPSSSPLSFFPRPPLPARASALRQTLHPACSP